MDYKELLNNSYGMECSLCTGLSHLEYLSVSIFDFITYDNNINRLFAQKALEVCNAITNGKNFEYQENKENYKWYLLMVNMVFFSNKLDWGTSIRGAWWNVGDNYEFHSCGLFHGEEQITDLKFDNKQWVQFMKAVYSFGMYDGGS